MAVTLERFQTCQNPYQTWSNLYGKWGHPTTWRTCRQRAEAMLSIPDDTQVVFLGHGFPGTYSRVPIRTSDYSLISLIRNSMELKQLVGEVLKFWAWRSTGLEHFFQRKIHKFLWLWLFLTWGKNTCALIPWVASIFRLFARRLPCDLTRKSLSFAIGGNI